MFMKHRALLFLCLFAAFRGGAALFAQAGGDGVLTPNLANTTAPVRVFPLGDSITHGGEGYASWRYPLWQSLTTAGANVNFTGSLDTVFGAQPSAADYPDYYSTFDRNHEGHWGFRTDEVLAQLDAWVASAQPDVTMIHLGHNDVGQQGASGVTAAKANLQTIIARLRAANPAMKILIAQVIPMSPMVGGSYGANAAQISALNTQIMSLAASQDTVQSPVVVADLFTGFDYATLTWDGVHPNRQGEARMAQCWLPALQRIIAGPLPTAPLIAIHPTPQAVAPGGTAMFTVNAAGHAPLTFQWKKNGAAIAGATGPSLNIANAQPGDAAFYSVTIGSPHGTTTSAAAVLGVGRHSMRFFGTGAPGGDRMKIALDAPARPVDVGAGDFTIELWLKALPGANQQPAVTAGASVTWINGNIFLDNDIEGTADFGDYGFSLGGGRVAFGCESGTGSARTIVGMTDVCDGRWHHIALTRAAATGQLRLWIDGALDASGTGPTGDLSYRDGRATSWPNDRFIVLGAEKHEFAAWFDNAFNGWLDELRFSTVARYPNAFTRPTAPFTPDAQTAALYHFDEGSGTTVLDTSGAAGGPSNGTRFIGGAQDGPVYDGATPFTETFAGWATTFVTNAAQRGPLANPDGDALPNLAEYALGQPPSVPADAIFAMRNAAGRLELTFPRQAAPDLTYIVEATSDLLAAWQPLFTSTGPTNVPATLTIADSLTPPGAQNRFIRLRITSP